MKRLLVLLLFTLLAGLAHGQMIPRDTLESLDVRVLNAKNVVVGRVESVVDTSTTDKGLHDVTLAVGETLKGPPQDRLTLSIWGSGDLWNAWKAKGTPLLVDVPSRPANPWMTRATALDDPGLLASTEAFAPLRTRDEVLRYVRRVVRENPGVESVETFPLKPPEGEAGATIRQALGHPRLYALVVPADTRVERYLRAQIRSGKPQERMEGARAIRVLKTPENVALLKGLLNDPGFLTYGDLADNRGVEVRHYVVREAAYQTLKWGWRLSVPQPTTTETVSRLVTTAALRVQGRPAAEDVAAIRGAKALTTLEVNGWGEVPPGLLDAVARATTLQTLTLSGANVHDADLGRLSALKSLRYLTLDGNPITDAGLPTLAAMKGLAEVNLGQTETTDAGLAALRRARPDLRVRPDRATSPLSLYVGLGDLEGIRRALRLDPAAVDRPDLMAMGGYALNEAAYERQLGATRLLLDHGAPVEGNGGDSPLQSALVYYRPELSIVELLLARGADPNRTRGDAVTPLDTAVANSNPQLANLLLASGADPDRADPSHWGYARPTPETLGVFHRFLQAKREVPPRVHGTAARCDRVVYALDAPDGPLGGWSTQKANAFSGGIGWSRTPSGRSYLGPFGQQTATFRLTKLPPHRNVQVEIELFVVGSWDGNGGLVTAPDLLDVRVPGVGTLLHSTFFNNVEGDAASLPMQSFPDPYPLGFHRGFTGAAETHSLGFPGARDGVYLLRFTFVHTASEFQIDLSGLTVAEGEGSLAESESWGLGRFVVRTD